MATSPANASRSAAILGEALASRYARHCEELLVRAGESGADVVPRDVAADAAADVEAVSMLLAPWLVA